MFINEVELSQFFLFCFSITQHKINSIAINVTGDWLAFGSSTLGQLLVWEWQSETYVLKQQGHFYDMNVMSYSPDGQFVATGGDDGKVKDSFVGHSKLIQNQLYTFSFFCKKIVFQI